MSDLNRIKQAMADGEHTDGDLQWAVDEIERLQAKLYRKDARMKAWKQSSDEHEARVEALEDNAVVDEANYMAALERIAELEAELAADAKARNFHAETAALNGDDK